MESCKDDTWSNGIGQLGDEVGLSSSAPHDDFGTIHDAEAMSILRMNFQKIRMDFVQRIQFARDGHCVPVLQNTSRSKGQGKFASARFLRFLLVMYPDDGSSVRLSVEIEATIAMSQGVFTRHVSAACAWMIFGRTRPANTPLFF